MENVNKNPKHVLAIIGSPRRGNSYRVTQSIEAVLNRLGDVRVEHLFLNRAELEPCRGCYRCVARGEQDCPIQDDRPSIVQRMEAADGVIMVSPVYTLNVTGLMKNFLGRIAYTAHRPPFLGKPAMLVTTTAGVGQGAALKSLSWFAVPGFDIVAKLGLVVHPVYANAPAQQKRVDRQIERAAGRFFRALGSLGRSPGLIRVIQFNALKANADFAGEYYQADAAYYQQRRWYHRDGEIGRLKRWLGRFFYRMVLGSIRGQLAKS